MTGNGINPGIGGVKPQEVLKKGNQGTGATTGLDFKKALEQFSTTGIGQGIPQTGVAQGPQKTGVVGAPAAAGLEKLKFSNHAIERMHSRGISFSPDEMKSIENAVAKAAAKGSKDSLILSGDNALIVSVKNSTVVTVMDRAAMKENVFTNIDSTVVL